MCFHIQDCLFGGDFPATSHATVPSLHSPQHLLERRHRRRLIAPRPPFAKQAGELSQHQSPPRSQRSASANPTRLNIRARIRRTAHVSSQPMCRTAILSGMASAAVTHRMPTTSRITGRFIAPPAAPARGSQPRGRGSTSDFPRAGRNQGTARCAECVWRDGDPLATDPQTWNSDTTATHAVQQQSSSPPACIAMTVDGTNRAHRPAPRSQPHGIADRCGFGSIGSSAHGAIYVSAC